MRKVWGTPDPTPISAPQADLAPVSRPNGDPEENRAFTAKQRAVQEAIAALKPFTTFGAIGAEIGFSGQFVSKKMKLRFKDDPDAMWLQGGDHGDWRIPRETAELFIREFYDC